MPPLQISKRVAMTVNHAKRFSHLEPLLAIAAGDKPCSDSFGDIEANLAAITDRGHNSMVLVRARVGLGALGLRQASHPARWFAFFGPPGGGSCLGSARRFTGGVARGGAVAGVFNEACSFNQF
jgi:hypothetical protein